MRTDVRDLRGLGPLWPPLAVVSLAIALAGVAPAWTPLDHHGVLNGPPPRVGDHFPAAVRPSGIPDRPAGTSLAGEIRSQPISRSPNPSTFLPESSQNVSSLNWAGYVDCVYENATGCQVPAAGGGVTGVEATWTVPAQAATGAGLQAVASWVGIGGFGHADLVQAGSIGEVSGSTPPFYSMWWEMLPLAAIPVSLQPDPTISAGDSVSAAVGYAGLSAGDQDWHFSLEDLSTHSSWSGSYLCDLACFPSTFASADWIVETPLMGGKLAQMPAFSSIEFQGLDFRTGASWSPPAPDTGNLTEIVQGNGAYLPDLTGVPSTLMGTPPVFFVSYLVDPEAALLNTGCCGFLPKTGEIGQRVDGALLLYSPDAVGPTPATTLGLTMRLSSTTNSSLICDDLLNGTVGLSLDQGFNSEPVRLSICPQLVYGLYSVSYWIWFVPAHVALGGPGALRLSEVQGPEPSDIVVTGPTVGPPVATPGSGAVDQGQGAIFDVAETGGVGPRTTTWEGLPGNCATQNSTSVRCQDLAEGSYMVRASVADSLRVRITSSVLSFRVMPAVVIRSIEISPKLTYAGEPVTLRADASGGSGNLTFAWSGLPDGCHPANESTITCAPTTVGRFTFALTVTDSNGGTDRANSGTVDVLPRWPAASSLASASVAIALAAVAAGSVVRVARLRSRS